MADALFDRISEIEKQISSTKNLVQKSYRELIISAVCSVFVVVVLLSTIKPKFIKKDDKVSIPKIIFYTFVISLILMCMLYAFLMK
jgi:hypothetical protein